VKKGSFEEKLRQGTRGPVLCLLRGGKGGPHLLPCLKRMLGRCTSIRMSLEGEKDRLARDFLGRELKRKVRDVARGWPRGRTALKRVATSKKKKKEKKTKKRRRRGRKRGLKKKRLVYTLKETFQKQPFSPGERGLTRARPFPQTRKREKFQDSTIPVRRFQTFSHSLFLYRRATRRWNSSAR